MTPQVVNQNPVSKLRMERLRRGMRQRELAAASGVTLSHISRLELRQSVPQIHTLHRLARGLGITDLNLIIEDPAGESRGQP
jgi:transcriptional regulator with XRE-family HTH domain